MIYYLIVTPNTDGNRLISPKEFLKAKGVPFTCFMAPNGKGQWLYEYDAKDESIIKELSEMWKDCVSVSQVEAKTLLETWGAEWMVKDGKLVPVFEPAMVNTIADAKTFVEKMTKTTWDISGGTLTAKK
jgi:hypothetical protein